jgi:hypothetical protein
MQSAINHRDPNPKSNEQGNGKVDFSSDLCLFGEDKKHNARKREGKETH